MRDRVSASYKYLGRKSKPSRGIANTASGARCKGRDGKNVVSFLNFGGSPKAYACTYWNGNSMKESDIAFDSSTDWITTRAVPANCKDALHLESVATHEWGHAFGLQHPKGDHPALTMQAGGTCDASKSTLGRGDVLGLRDLY